MTKHSTLIFMLFIVLVVMTFPLIFNLFNCIPAFFSTDESLTVLWDAWRIKYAFQHHLSFTHTDFIAYPFGHDVYSAGYVSYVWLLVLYTLSIVTQPALTYNFLVLGNLLLCSLAIYFLGWYLVKNKKSAFFSALIFTFCPYQFARMWQHIGLTFNEWIPLCLLTIIALKDKPNRKNWIFFILSLFLLFSFDFILMFLTGMVLSAFMLYVLFFDFKEKLLFKKRFPPKDLAFFKKAVFAGLCVGVLLSPQFYPVIKSRLSVTKNTIASAFSSQRRPFDDLFTQSARPLSYFLPAAVHPVFGKITDRFVGSDLYGVSYTEHSLYLGWTPLILAFFAVRRWRRLIKTRNEGHEERQEKFYIGFFVFLAIAAWLFSQPPWWQIGPLKIYMPSFFMYKILPMYRAYCRFGIVVMFAVAVLAGFGLKFFLERFKTDKKKLIVSGVLCCLVLFEFWNWPPFKVMDVSKTPAVYSWLKVQPGNFTIAEYPLDYKAPNDFYKFYQTIHEKKIINSTSPGTYPNKVANTMVKLSSLRTAGILRWMGVKYVLVHIYDYQRTDLIDDLEELKRIPSNPGLKLVGKFSSQECPDPAIMCMQKISPVDVYEVVARPIKP